MIVFESNSRGRPSIKRKKSKDGGTRTEKDRHLTEAILERQRLDAERLHALQLFLIKVLEFVHGDEAVAIEVHAPASIHPTARNHSNSISKSAKYPV